MIKPVHH